ncbi:MAG: hypothetical protein ACRD0C_00820 [Acidimicrobiia bacterium]
MMAVLAIVAAASLSGCAKTMVSASAKTEPFKLELINEAEGLNRITLEPEAAKKIGIETQKLGVLFRFGGESQRTTVPYGAVLYDAKGSTFVYTNPKPLVFVRHPITVDYVEDDLAVLVSGPPSGTSVVHVGVAELQGIEFGVGK